jgi:hypothetical protein
MVLAAGRHRREQQSGSFIWATPIRKQATKMGLSRIQEKRDAKRDIPVKNGIPQIRTDKRCTVFGPGPGSLCPVFGPVSVYPGKNENGREKQYTVADGTGLIPSVFIFSPN